jgi:hypothetical protein
MQQPTAAIKDTTSIQHLDKGSANMLHHPCLESSQLVSAEECE